MATLAQLVVLLTADTGQFDKEMSGVGKKLDKVSGSLRKAGGIMTAAVTAPLMIMGQQAVSAASDLEESMNKVDVVFGDSANAVKAWSDTSAESFGLTKQAALEAAGTFGGLFTTMGLSADEAASMSKELVQLAGDMASFNNIPVDVALEKLRAGLVGEYEPLRTTQVLLDAATVKAKAMAMGLGESEDALTQSALAQARYALIMEQTVVQQGDFANTSEGLANSMRILQSKIGDLAAELGMVLLPYVTAAVQWIGKLVGWLQTLSPAAQKVAVVLGAVAAAIGPILMGIGMMIPAIEAAAAAIGVVVGILGGPVTIAIAAVIAAVAALAWAWNSNFMGIRDKTQEVIDFIKPYIESAMAFIQNTVGAVLDALRAWWQEHGDSVMTIVNAFLTPLKNVFEMNLQAIQLIVTTVLDFVRGLWESHGETVMTVINAMWETIKIIFSTALDVIGGLVDAFAALLTGDFETMKEELIGVAESLWDGYQAAFEVGTEAVYKVVTHFVDSITGWITGLVDMAFDAGAGLAQRFADGIMSKLQAAVDAAKRMAEKLRSYLPGSDAKVGPLKDLYKSGRAFGDTFAKGIERSIPDVTVAGVAAVSAIAPGQGAGGAGPTQIVNLTVNNPEPRAADADIFEKMFLLGAMGAV